MARMKLSEMETYLHDHIPITAHQGVRMLAFDAGGVRLRAPLAPNINHRDTAFGGSLSSLGILAGWALIHFSLQQLAMPSRIVIQSSKMDFLAPGDADFEAVAGMPDQETWQRFLLTLQKRGRARLALTSQVKIGDTRVATHAGVYVAILNERLG